MNRARPTLRNKLLALLSIVGGIGLASLLLILATADRQLFDRFLPENRAMRDIEARSALLVQNYYRFMLTPELVTVDEMTGASQIIQQRLANFRRLVAGQGPRELLADSIRASIERLDEAGHDLILARLRFDQINELQADLEDEVNLVFARYKQSVDLDSRRALSAGDFGRLTSRILPELRMIQTLHLLYLQLFLEVRGYQAGPGGGNLSVIDGYIRQIDDSSVLLRMYEENATERAWLATHVLVIYEKMLEVVEKYRLSKKSADFALSLAEQAGIDLNHEISVAIGASESLGWEELRRSLLLSGLILVATLVVSYLSIYAGLHRIVRPLEQLQVVIKRLGKGDFSQRSVDVIRNDEIGQLATSFNRMADQLERNDEQRQEFIGELEQKNMELQRFTYTVSHELKSPLVTVKGFLGLLEKDMAAKDSERMRNDMNKIAAAVDIMSKQLEDLLELSRVGRQINQSAGFSLNETCHDVLRMMQGLIDERDAEVVIENGMPEVFADQARIREVIKNLVENAIKFTPPDRRPRVEISAEPGNGSVLCRVCDNGPGIDPRYHDRVFGLFDRLDPGVPGTGIGLALVKRIVELHGGDIWIETRGDGQGCCFCFTLPAHGGN